MFKETLTDPQQKMRAYMDTDCDEYLKVWFAEGAAMQRTEDITEFRLTYNMLSDPHGILWKIKEEHGETSEIFAHVGVDDGEDTVCIDPEGQKQNIHVKMSPVAVLNGVFEENDIRNLAEDFLSRATKIDKNIADFVYKKLLAFPPEQFVHKPHG